MAPKGKKKSPPVMSHEFIIQNHADIVAVIAMVFMLGLMVEFLHPLASSFIAISHNVTYEEVGADGSDLVLYRPGMKDVLAVFFYTLIMILAHAVIQEFILDKFNKKQNLSKAKFAKFNESGQLAAFYTFSFVFAGSLLWNAFKSEGSYAKLISSFWTGFPDSHFAMEWALKLFYILQISYWVHVFPELYFTKTKKEDMAAKVEYASLYLLAIIAGYAMHYHKVLLVLLAIHYLVEGTFHVARVFYFLDLQHIAQGGFKLWSYLFVLVRLATVAIAVLTFWFGFGQVHENNPSSSTSMVARVTSLSAICIMQAWMSWNFITFQMKRKRDAAGIPQQKKAMKAANGSPSTKGSKKKQ
ncbi:translocating chain-associated membrane protein 1-like 1 [Watersipora subatra]|uniref:translocating chain-associated membrane protein 1-like 1 n=1 Tax=Watersipora subatra TaxID=2589382 RepID=UPI00355B498A